MNCHFPRTEFPFTLIYKCQTIPPQRNNLFIWFACLYPNVHVKCWSSSVHRSCHSNSLPGNQFYFDSIGCDSWNFFLREFLVLRLAHLEFFLEVYPQLKTFRHYIEASWHFRMQYSSTSCHPLDITSIYCTRVPFEVFMADRSFQHVGDSLKASMRVIRETCG